MRRLLFVGLGLLLMPCEGRAQAARHEVGATLRGDPSEWFDGNSYPRDAADSGREGRVMTTISVDLTGTATGCAIKVSSGTASLDKAACDIALANAVFDPAIDRDGKPTTSNFDFPVKWVLPKLWNPVDANKAKLSGYAEVQVRADSEGKLISCRNVITDRDEPDLCELYRPGSQIQSLYARDGRKVGSTITSKTTSTLTIDP
jgi:TonB family protein